MINISEQISEHPRHHQLKIAACILEKSIKQFGREWDCSDVHIRHVAIGINTSERIERKIDDVIEEAQELVPFDYPETEEVA